MDFNNMIYQTKKFFINYFDIYSKVNRKEFNFAILIYSLIFIASLFTVTDTSTINNELQNQVAELQHDALSGNISQEQAALKAMDSVKHLIPDLFMHLFALLLLPLYIRRLNDTVLNTIAFITPVVALYSYDVYHSMFDLSTTFRMYDALSATVFIIIALLCIMPTKEDKETEGY